MPLPSVYLSITHAVLLQVHLIRTKFCKNHSIQNFLNLYASRKFNTDLECEAPSGDAARTARLGAAGPTAALGFPGGSQVLNRSPPDAVWGQGSFAVLLYCLRNVNKIQQGLQQALSRSIRSYHKDSRETCQSKTPKHPPKHKNQRASIEGV